MKKRSGGNAGRCAFRSWQPARRSGRRTRAPCHWSADRLASHRPHPCPSRHRMVRL